MVLPNSGDRCIPVAISCSFSPAVCWIARIGQTSRPKSARLPVTKQTLRAAVSHSRACMLALLGKLISRRSINSATRRSPRGRRAEHRKPVHQRPGRAGAEAGGVECGQHLVALAGMGFVEQDRVEPVIAGGALRLAREMHAGNVGESAVIGRRQQALFGQKAVELFKLGASQRGVEIGHAGN